MFSARWTSPDLGIGGHDHLDRPFPARQPAAEGAVDEAVAVVVVDVLAEVPDRAVVGLGVVVERDLFDPPVDVGGVLGDAGLDLLARGSTR